MSVIMLNDIKEIEVKKDRVEAVLKSVNKMRDFDQRLAECKQLKFFMERMEKEGKLKTYYAENPTAEPYPMIVKKEHALRKDRDQAYYEIRSVLLKIVELDYPHLFTQYIDYQNTNAELKKEFNNCLNLLFYRNEITNTISEIKTILEEGLVKKTPIEVLNRLKSDYERLIVFIKAAYDEENSRSIGNQDFKLKQLHFLEEIDFNDNFITLSFLQIMENNVLLPIFSQYERVYNKYLVRHNYLLGLLERIDELRQEFIKKAKEETPLV